MIGVALFNQEQADFIRKHSDGRRDQELCRLVNDKFGLSITKQQMSNWRGNHNARSSISLYGWKKGKEAGKDFKPQKEFRNSMPIGSEFVTKGIVQIKVSKGKWIPKHRFLWEEVNGPVPKNHVVIFSDGNNRNFNIDNLILISRKHLAILNKKRLLVEGKELREIAINYAKLVEKIVEKKKEGSGNA